MSDKKKNKPLLPIQSSVESSKMPPQAVDLEQAVLGGMMLDGSALSDVIDILNKPEVFYKESHQRIFNAIKTLFERAEPVDILTVTHELKKTGELEIVGGAFYITQLTNRIASSANIQMHARIIIEKFLQRELIRISATSLQEAYQDTSDVFNLLDNAEQDLFFISNIFVKKNFESAKAVAIKTMEEIEAMRLQSGTTGVPSGFKKLDDITGGFQKGELIILAARPSVGKSSVAAQFARNAAVDFKIPAAFFSLEMTSTSLMMRMFSGESEIPAERIRRGLLDSSEYNLLNSKIGPLVSSPLYIDDTPHISLFEFRSKARRLKAQYGVQLIIVDYLQLMTVSDGTGRSREQEVSMISRSLKGIAKELELPIIALSQLSRETEKRIEKKGRPQLSDLRESGCLHGDTLIYCPHIKRMVKIRDLCDKENFNVLSTDYKKVVTKTAKKCFRTGKKQLYQLSLINGQKIKATSNHKFLTIDGWKELGKLKKDDIVAIPINYGDKKDLYNKHEISLIGHFLANGSCITHGKTSPVADIMRKYGIFNVRGKDKFIPDELFFLSHKNTCILLKSLFSGDGTVFYYEKGGRKTLKISYSSSSEKLITGIQSLLAKVGIVSFISHLKNDRHSWFNLYICGKSNIEQFVKNIGFWNKRKNDIMIDGWKKSKNNLPGWTKYSFNKERGLCYMPIKNIRKSCISDVYDIEVDNLHNFTANGIIVHNSLEQDADIVMFLYRAEKHGYETDDDGNSTKGVAEIIIAKHRNGRTGSEIFFFNEFLSRFEDNSALTFSVINQDPLSAPAPSITHTPNSSTPPASSNDIFPDDPEPDNWGI